MLPTASDLDDPDGFVHREQLGEAASGTEEKPDLKKKDDDSE